MRRKTRAVAKWWMLLMVRVATQIYVHFTLRPWPTVPECVIFISAFFFPFPAQAWESAGNSSGQSPNPNNPAEYCSTIPPLQQAQASGALSSPPPTVMVPVGVLKQPGTEGKAPRSTYCSTGSSRSIDTLDEMGFNDNVFFWRGGVLRLRGLIMFISLRENRCKFILRKFN